MRLFVAVWPPDDVLDLIARLPRPDGPGLRWTTRDQWHVTLRFLGEVDDLSVVTDALAPLGDRALATEAVLGPAVEVLSRRVVMVPVAGLDAVADAVITATAGIGRPPEDRPFVGHLTLARSKDGRSLRPLTGAAVSARWPVGAVCVVRSRLSPRGARYETVATAPLGAAEGA